MTSRWVILFYLVVGYAFLTQTGLRALDGSFGLWFWVDALAAVLMLVNGGLRQARNDRLKRIERHDARVAYQRQQWAEVDRWASLDAEMAMTSHDDVLRRLPDDVLAGLGWARTKDGGVQSLARLAEREAILARERARQQDWDRMAAAALTAGITHAELEQVQATVEDLLVAGTDVEIDYDDTTDRLTVRRDSTAHMSRRQVAELKRRQELCAHPEAWQVEVTEVSDQVPVYACRNCGWRLTREEQPCVHDGGLTRISTSSGRTDRLLCDRCGTNLNQLPVYAKAPPLPPTRPSPTRVVRY